MQRAEPLTNHPPAATRVTATVVAPTAAAAITDPAATQAWLQALQHYPVQQAAPMLIVRVEGLLRQNLSPHVHLRLLRLLKRPLLKLTAALPDPDPRLPHGGFANANGLTLQQRLDLAMQRNLQMLFQECDRQRYAPDAPSGEEREWVLRNLFKFLRRLVRYAVLARRTPPTGTWQELHDLFVYQVIRGNVRVADSVQVSFLDGGFDPETEYKRLLLMGHAHQCNLPGTALLAMIPRLTEWAQGTRLLDPGGQLGVFDLLLVEVSHDAPVRRQTGTLDAPFRGWVLAPDRHFMAFCRHHHPARPVFDPDHPFRTV